MTPQALDRFDAIVIGSGPGGATVAKELSESGLSVLVLEKGKDIKKLGNYATALKLFERGTSREGFKMMCASTTGGTSVFYSASAAEPPSWLHERYGIDLSKYVTDVKNETGVAILPREFLGEASIKVMAAANRLGHDWEPMEKWFDPSKFKNGRSCGANTHLGRNYEEKWTARDYLYTAVHAGATLLTETECLDVIVEGNTAVGVIALSSSGNIARYYADRVILCGGGLSTPLLLKRCGLDHAGDGCFSDPAVVLYGEAPFEGSWQDPPVSVGTWEHWHEGIRIGTMMEPKGNVILNLAKTNRRKLGMALKYKRLVGIMVKVKDDLSGKIFADGSISKSLGTADLGRIAKGSKISRNILREVGCPEDTIITGEVVGSHPSGTCRIGDVVDENLQTEIGNLFVCDASVFPEALDIPTVLTITAFGKRLAEHLVSAKEKTTPAASAALV